MKSENKISYDLSLWGYNDFEFSTAHMGYHHNTSSSKGGVFLRCNSKKPTQYVKRFSEVASEILCTNEYKESFQRKKTLSHEIKEQYDFINYYDPIMQPTSRYLEQAKTGCQGETFKKGDRL